MINVIGLGYIGLPTALMLASHGVEVVGTDYNAELVATLNAGRTTFKEKGLDELFEDALKAGINFSTEYQVTDTYVVSVPTPYDKFSKKVDPCYLISAVKSVMNVCPKGATVVIESTVSPGTIDKYVRPVIEENGFVKQLLTKVSDEPAPLRVAEPTPTAADDKFEQLSIESHGNLDAPATNETEIKSEIASEKTVPALIEPEDLADMGMANVLSNSARDKKRAERSKMGYMFDTLIHNNF